MSLFWTAEKIETLATQWGYSNNIKAIALMLGCSRNSVIGKAHRLNLPMHTNSCQHPEKKRKTSVRKPYQRKARYTAAPAFKVLPLPEPQPFAPEPLNILFNDLGARHCRYAVTDELPHLFCGHPKEVESPYCEFHKDLCTGVRRGYTDRNRPGYTMARAA